MNNSTTASNRIVTAQRDVGYPELCSADKSRQNDTKYRASFLIAKIMRQRMYHLVPQRRKIARQNSIIYFLYPEVNFESLSEHIANRFQHPPLLATAYTTFPETYTANTLVSSLDEAILRGLADAIIVLSILP